MSKSKQQNDKAVNKENPPEEPILTVNGFGSAGDRIKKNILDRLEKEGFNRDHCDSTIVVIS
jgi:hypothetical protein